MPGVIEPGPTALRSDTRRCAACGANVPRHKFPKGTVCPVCFERSRRFAARKSSGWVIWGGYGAPGTDKGG